MRKIAAALFIGLFTVPAYASPSDAGPQPQRYEFAVSLDGDKIGTHVFNLSRPDPHSYQLISEAHFVATFLNVPVYRYDHNAKEAWNSGCLTKLTAVTHDDGTISDVAAQGSAHGGEVTIKTSANNDQSVKSKWEGCLMTFAYWNPALLKQKHLLNPQSGEIEDVTITAQPNATIDVHGQKVEAKVWRIEGSHEPVDVLYGPDGAWIGLNATLKGGYALAYRLP